MKKSLTFIFAAALLVSCQQEENEATTPANSRITISPIITRATEVNFETGDKMGYTHHCVFPFLSETMSKVP